MMWHLTTQQKQWTMIGAIATLALAASALALCWPRLASAAPAGGTVGTGTPASCTETALNTALGGGGTVTFDCGANPYTLTLTIQKIITVNTTIDGGNKITLSGGQAVRLFGINGATSLTVKNITLADGRDAFGGCVFNAGAFTAIHATLRNCHSITKPFAFPAYGGAIAALGGNIYLSNTQLLNNIADMHGGGIFATGGLVQLDGVDLIGNSAQITYPGSGGGVYVASGSLLIVSNSHIDRNLFGYQGQGGAIAAYASTVQIDNATLSNNLGANAGDGGGLYLNGSNATLDHTTISGNRKVYDGGGIATNNSGLTVTNSTIQYNVASAPGAGINTFGGSLSLDLVHVDDNVGGEDGGGIDLYSTPSTFTRSTVNRNIGDRDGGAMNVYRSTLTLDRVTMSGNECLSDRCDAGAIYNSDSVLIVTNSTLDHNVTSGHGGAIYNASGSTSNLTNVTLSANTAISGGAVYNEEPFSSDSSIITLTNVTVKDNRAPSGAAIFNANGPLDLVYLKNTAIADNPGGNCTGKAPASAKYSLSSDDTCNLFGITNLNSTPAQLFPLANNGGPTETHMPTPSSPLVNGVFGPDFPATDQRGVARPQGVGSDIGSVERKPSDPLVAPWVYVPIVRR